MEQEQLEQTKALSKLLETEAGEIARHICGTAGDCSEKFPLARGDVPEQEHHELITTGLLMPIIEMLITSHCVGNEILQQQVAEKLFTLGAMCMSGDMTRSDVVIQRIDTDDIEAMAMMESMTEVKH
jgi:hypothetical protein